MGANLSKTQYKNVYTATTNVMNQVLNQQMNNIITNSNLIQKIRITTGPGAVTKCSGNLNVTLDGKSSVNAIYALQNSVNTSVTNNIIKELQDKITNAINQTNTGGVLNLGQVNSNVNNTEIQKTINTNITNSIKNAITNTAQTSTSGDQSIVFENLGYTEVGGDCNFSNKMVIDQFVRTTIDNIASSLVSTVDGQKVTTDTANQIAQANDGSIAGMLFGNLGSMQSIIMIVVVLTIVGGIGAIIIKKKNEK